jgi:hypothetical protein
MSFLDNSGDIILDATLTETGRARMAQGGFRIAKYALGDDEIDYSLYNKTHPSGSAYYDLEILQTPIFEAFTKSSANINAGLLTNTRMDLLYLPIIVPNHKVSNAVQPTGSVYYLTVNNETRVKIADTWGTAVDESKYLLESGNSSYTGLVFESGLNTTDFKGTATTRTNYIINTALFDSSFEIYMDNRFLAGGLTAPAAAAGITFSNTPEGSPDINLLPLAPAPSAGTAVAAYAHYTSFTARSVADTVYYYPGGTDDTTISALNGPRGAATILNFNVNSELAATSTGVRSVLYGQYGTKGNAVFGGSNLFDYIDTTVYIQGASSGARTQIPLRIIRYAGT